MMFTQFGLLAALALQIISVSRPLPAGIAEVDPHPSAAYRTVALCGEYQNEDIPKSRGGPAIKGVPDGVKYITDPYERERYRLRFGSDGLIYDAEGNRFDTTNGVRINEHGVKSFPRLAMFVMDERGHFYASAFQQVGVFHHSSLVAGRPVAASGELEVVAGRLQSMNDRSGHYRVPLEITHQAVERLQQLLPLGTMEALEKNGKIQLIGGKDVPSTCTAR
jgi:hypothetical protein